MYAFPAAGSDVGDEKAKIKQTEKVESSLILRKPFSPLAFRALLKIFCVFFTKLNL